jgi:formate C-acetyltransferase
MEQGVSREGAYRYSPVGCNEIGIPGMLYYVAVSKINRIKIIDIAMSKNPDELKTFSDFCEAVKREMYAQVGKSYEQGLVQLMMKRLYKQVPLTSCIFDGCAERGVDLSEQTKYNIVSVGGPFFSNMVDSMAAIREVVYEKQEATLREVAEACAANFEGCGSLRQKLVAAPKHGNDDVRVEDIVHLIEEMQHECVQSICRHPKDGTPAGISHVTRSSAVRTGKVTGATPDGRYAGTPLASSVASSSGTENKGPTAVLKSMMSMNPKQAWQSGYNANIRFTQNLLKRPENRGKVRMMLNTFFANGGQELQVNCVDTKILREAQKHPEQYRDLVVRVAGFSEFFAKLTPDMQEEIISRESHSAI